VTIAECEADRRQFAFGHGDSACPLGIKHDVRQVAAPNNGRKQTKREAFRSSGKPQLARPSVA
jgi:hypothetical protein